MTIGSAVSLAAARPQEPLSLFRTPDIKVVHPQSFGGAPPRPASLQKAAAGPPGTRVLVVDEDAVAALHVQQMLRECGYRVVGPASSCEEALRLVERGPRPIHCTLISACAPGSEITADAIKARGIPVVWTALGNSDAFSWDRRAEPVLRDSFGPQELRQAIERSLEQVASRRLYAVPPPQPVWPRVFPQL